MAFCLVGWIIYYCAKWRKVEDDISRIRGDLNSITS